ncbi:DUF3817 domain-containing protein [Candidatus Saccharibacteria bacterium]|nr:DUF3817 domain-containing protein [Candidatus Saccharibacteria bacterium]
MDTIKTKATNAYDQLDNIFTQKEAWALYTFAAYAETIGWMLLLFGIFSKINKWPLYEWSLGIGGYIHGIIFVFYILIVFFAHRSMKWNIKQFVAAEVLSNIPFGALAFERYITKKKRR